MRSRVEFEIKCLQQTNMVSFSQNCFKCTIDNGMTGKKYRSKTDKLRIQVSWEEERQMKQ